MTPLLRALLAVLPVMLLLMRPVSADDFPPILATAEGEHAWIVMPNIPNSTELSEPTAACYLVHYFVADGPNSAHMVRKLSEWPEAIVSSGRQLWIVFPPRNAELGTRDVASLQVQRDPASGFFYALPHNHLEVLASLPKVSKVEGIATRLEQLFAMVRPSQRAARGMKRDTPGSAKNRDEELIQETSLLRQDGLEWVSIEGPSGLGEANAALLGNASLNGERHLAVAWPGAQGAGSMIAIGLVLESKGNTSKWQIETIEVPFQQLHAILAVEGGMLLVHGEETIEFSYVRAKGRLAKLGSVQLSSEARDVAALPEGLRIFQRQADRFTVREVGLIDGVVSEKVDITENTDGVDWLQIPFSAIYILTVLVCVLILRPFIDSTTSDPSPDLQPMLLSRRIAALVIDFIPGAIVVVAIFGPSSVELTAAYTAILTDTSLPIFVAIMITGLHSVVSEVLWGTSMGKMIFGGRIVGLDGELASRIQRGLRGASKIAILLMPLIALLVLFDPLSRGLPELISRTVVVARTSRRAGPVDPSTPPEEQPKDSQDST